MRKIWPIICFAILIQLLFSNAYSEKRSLYIDNADKLDWIKTDSGMISYGVGNVRLRLDSTWIHSDTVFWNHDAGVIKFFGHVDAFDSTQRILAGRITYFDHDSTLVAEKSVIMMQYADSIRTESNYAEFDRKNEVVILEGSPVMFLNYPDLANLVEIRGKSLTFFSDTQEGMAEEDVVIVHRNTIATSDCAEFYPRKNMLTLIGSPHAVRDSSVLDGDLMHIKFNDDELEKIDVFGNATALFSEEADSTDGQAGGQSKLAGQNVSFYFQGDEVRLIAASGAASSEYYPSVADTTGAGKNIVSGDSIKIFVNYRKVSKIDIKGGAEGIYITQRTVDSTDQTASDSTSADSMSVATVEPVADSTLFDSVLVRTDLSLTSDSTDMEMTDSSIVLSGIVEDSIYYTGSYLEYFAKENILRITEGANVRQDKMELEAHRIDYALNDRVVLAQAKADTVDLALDSILIVPLSLKDGAGEILGSHLVFNVDTKKGIIRDATTAFEKSYYRGKDLYKEEEEVFYVEDGRLSSCDLAEPHFHFRATEMKLVNNDRVIARPVRLYIETLPVMILPYYVFPLKRGRHSGILPLKLGSFEAGNRYLGNLGYYWAASEYWDLQSSLDFYENIGFTFNNRIRYNKRYKYSGSLSAKVTREREEFASSVRRKDRWEIRGDHKQTLPYEIDFGASGQFISDNSFYTDYSIDPDDRLNRNIISKANMSKNFGWGRMSLSFNHTDNIDTDSRSSNLPSGSFSVPGFHPFGSGKKVDGKTIKSWYNKFYVSYSNRFRMFTSRAKLEDGSNTRKEYGYVDHSYSIKAPQTLFTHLTLTPSASFKETWYYILKTDQAHAFGIPGDRSYRRASVSAGLSSSTKLYGTFPVGLFGLESLRHVLSPTVGFSMAPAITQNNAVKSYVGVGGGGGKSKTMTFGLNNLIQAKVKSGETEQKLDILSIRSSTRYNFEATGRKFSDLTTSISSGLLKKLNLSGGMTHELYNERDELIWRSPRLRSFSLNGSIQAKGSVADSYAHDRLDTGIDEDTLSVFDDTQNRSTASSRSTDKTTWNMNLRYAYSESRSLGTITSRSHFVTITGNMDLTPNIKIKYSQRYDFIRHETIEKRIDIYRQMHCWEGQFFWIPEGSRQGFYFKINVIAIPDIKIEKSESGLRGALLNR